MIPNLKSILVLISVVILFTAQIECNSLSKLRGAGPHVNQTKGEPWPYPQHVITYGDQFMVVRPSKFQFQIVNNTCDLIEQALKRYYIILLKYQKIVTNSFEERDGNGEQDRNYKNSEFYRGYLDVLKVDLKTSCEPMPHEDMDESYKIQIDTEQSPKEGILSAKTNWGILRGLETFSQLVHHTNEHSALRIKTTWIKDYPRFSFRSVLLDTARHFIPKKFLLDNLDLMAMNKMNVFHWHIVDDQSFPYQSKRYPDLSNKGSYHRFTHVYSQKDIAEIIEYARLRGIRVVPEFDSPGHTQSWGPGAPPGLLTECYKNDTETGELVPDGTFGPIDPTNIANYDFLKNLFAEIVTVFPDQYLHLGGDEVDFSCWESNPIIQDIMMRKNWTDYSQLEEFYMQNLVEIVESFPQNKSYIIWQEVLDNGVKVQADTVVNVWKGGSFQKELDKVTKKGYRSLLYACWYLDNISWGIDWPKYYGCDPQNFNGTVEQNSLVIGGGAALWAEFVDATNLISRLWPRASAPAERLWSPAIMNDVEEAESRMEEHRCRLLMRGYNVEPANGPGFCLVEWGDNKK